MSERQFFSEVQNASVLRSMFKASGIFSSLQFIAYLFYLEKTYFFLLPASSIQIFLSSQAGTPDNVGMAMLGRGFLPTQDGTEPESDQSILFRTVSTSIKTALALNKKTLAVQLTSLLVPGSSLTAILNEIPKLTPYMADAASNLAKTGYNCFTLLLLLLLLPLCNSLPFVLFSIKNWNVSRLSWLKLKNSRTLR